MRNLLVVLSLCIAGCSFEDPDAAIHIETLRNRADKRQWIQRIEVPGGWLVSMERGVCFYPDPDHKWLAPEAEKQ